MRDTSLQVNDKVQIVHTIIWYFTDDETGRYLHGTCHMCLDGQLRLCQRLACEYNCSKVWLKHSSNTWYIILTDCQP